MAKKKDADKEFMDQARKNIKRGLDADSDMIQKFRYMGKFLMLNEQWDPAERRRRDENRRPMLTLPILKQYCNQVVGELRQGTLNIEVVPSDNKGTYKIAKVLEGHVRDILYNSQADAIFDFAAQSAVYQGLGMFSVSTEDSEVNSFLQEIIIKLEDADTIICDPDAMLPTLSDATFWCKTYGLPKERFEDEYKGKYDKSALEEHMAPTFLGSLPLTSNYQGWYKEGYIQLAEYYVKEYHMEKRVLLSDGNEYTEEEGKKKLLEDRKKRKSSKLTAGMASALMLPPNAMGQMASGQSGPMGPVSGALTPFTPQAGPTPGPGGVAPMAPGPQGAPGSPTPQMPGAPPSPIMEQEEEEQELKVLDRHDVNVPCWYRYIIYGDGILVGPEEFVGDQPFFPVFGLMSRIDGKRVWSGLVNDGIFAQKLINEWVTDDAERLKNTLKTNFFITPHQTRGFEAMWKRASEISYPGLPYNPDPTVQGGGPVPYKPGPPQVNFQQIQQMQQFVMQAVGMYGSDLGAKTGMVQTGSGEAQLQKPGDTAAFHFADNLNRAKDALVRNLVKMILKLYDTKRDVRMMEQDDNVGYTIINARAKDVLKSYKENPERYSMVEERDLEDYIKDNGDEEIYNKMIGKYAVKTKPGPASSTMREENAKSLFEFMKMIDKQPDTPKNTLLQYEIAKNINGLEGLLPKMREMLVLQGVLEPKRDEIQKVQKKRMMMEQQKQKDPRFQKTVADVQFQGQKIKTEQMKQSNEQLKHQENILKIKNAGTQLGKEVMNVPDMSQIEQIIEQKVTEILQKMLGGGEGESVQ
jgi:Phage P22-like portal protein